MSNPRDLDSLIWGGAIGSVLYQTAKRILMKVLLGSCLKKIKIYWEKGSIKDLFFVTFLTSVKNLTNVEILCHLIVLPEHYLFAALSNNAINSIYISHL